ncbi:MAG: choice-of-anchor J domain-containing protein [Muribaculaceae bacterium]|nr:choice-of-anchor J domain-containing protein [Muribaculaceae bacterium]
MNLKNQLQKVLCMVAVIACGLTAVAQSTLLKEDFNGTAEVFPPAGWTVINSDAPGAVNHWESYFDSRTSIRSAHVKSPSYDEAEPVKEEVLITPKVTLNGYYDLNFTWEGATAQSINRLPNAEYDFQVRVREVGSESWTTIFSFLDEEMVRNAGVGYPWTAWTWNPSAINLTDWNGKTVEFAFVYRLLKAGPGSGNDIWLDDVSIVESQQITGPVASIAPDSYEFPTTYIGAKKYSDTMTLKNVGRDVLTVTGVKGLEGTDFGSTLEAGAVSLKTGETYEFQFWYAPTTQGGARATAVVETNGGDVEVALSGTKKMVAEGGVYEGFEGETFPPLGWSKNGGGWYRYGAGLTGEASAVCGFPEDAELITPRLDLSSGDAHSIKFSYFESFEPMSDDTNAPANYFKVCLSTDGGKTYKDVFNSEGYDVNALHDISVELDGQGSNDCYIKFWSYIPNFSMSGYDEVPDYSMIFVDDVMLPTLYGREMPPASSTAISPADGAENVYHKNLELQWSGELFATNYKLYLGKAADKFDVIDGMDMGEATSYTVARLDYNTKYYWKVVGYNGNIANTEAPTWSFTVMEDQSVTELPYSEDFDNGYSLGWNIVKDGATKWDLSNVQAYGGKGHSAMASGYQEGTKAILETPEIKIPAGSESLISFVWGNAAPVGLTIDETGERVNTTTEPGKQCCVFFDIEVDGEWKNLAMLHEEGETKYWYRESFPLKEYAGKTVAFRWRYEVYNMMAAAASLDNVLIESISGDKAMVAFNYESWDAGYVNNGKSVTSRNPILLSNIGLDALKVKSVAFKTANFTTTLAAGTEIASNRSASLAVTYAAGTTAGEVEDEMTVTFENGLSAAFPVKGTTLAADIYYYGFEEDEHASTQPAEFTTVDRDGYATVEPIMIYYPKRGTPFAYIVLNCTGAYADWRNVYPVSGEQVLASFGESTGNRDTDDWIISSQLKATAQSNFRFYAKCYGDETQVFSQNHVEVLVSTTDKEIASFESVLSSQKIPWAGTEGKWTEYNVDLSSYAGKEIYVAVRHTADKDGFVSFFDDFWFEHFDGKETGIENVVIESGNAAEELYNLNGVRVSRDNATPGIYISRKNGVAEKIIIR